ncbi:MAG: glycogen/starch synthase [Bacteroidales bacterium]|jgi:starch synthase|nr:glycogen/starch synthase [Bacteroidales bacterium]
MKLKVLFVAQEIAPYVPENEMSLLCRKLPQKIQELGNEIRIFMPKFGVINERRNQLHEVIRLSGMNLVINDADHPLIIKVASIQPIRMQVYFIDNEDLFQKKYALTNNGDDNFTADEKSIFFSKGVIETVKKLGWSPNIVHCHGWFSALFPFIMRNVYCNDPMFANNCKVVYSIYNDSFSGSIDKGLAQKLVGKNVTIDMLDRINEPTWDNLTKFAIDNSDGIILAAKDIKPEIIQYIKDSGKPMLEYTEGDEKFEDYEKFYNKVSEN